MTLGRQALLEPIEWTADGWFRAAGGDVGEPLRMPAVDKGVAHGMALSGSFTPERFDLVWRFFQPGSGERDRVSLGNGVLTLAAKGTSPKDSVPLFLTAGDRAYEVEAVMDFDDGAQAGILLFYSKALYVGLGFSAQGMVMHRYGQERNGARLPNLPGKRVHVRMVNRHHIVTFFTSPDGKAWTKYGVQMEVSGYHQNVGGDFQALRTALYAAGKGKVRFSDFRYRALP
jgi:xylan 1,4-beta-xylosidase